MSAPKVRILRVRSTTLGSLLAAQSRQQRMPPPSTADFETVCASLPKHCQKGWSAPHALCEKRSSGAQLTGSGPAPKFPQPKASSSPLLVQLADPPPLCRVRKNNGASASSVAPVQPLG